MANITMANIMASITIVTNKLKRKRIKLAEDGKILLGYLLYDNEAKSVSLKGSRDCFMGEKSNEDR